jgi:hypothetical protein
VAIDEKKVLIKERLSMLNALPPASRATDRDVIVPDEYASNNNAVWVLAPSTAAPVRIKPRIGPAHGAQSNPVATPSSKDRDIPALTPSTWLECVLAWNRALRLERTGSVEAARKIVLDQLSWLLTQDDAVLEDDQKTIQTLLSQRLNWGTAPSC